MCASVPCAIAVILLRVFVSLALDAHRRTASDHMVSFSGAGVLGTPTSPQITTRKPMMLPGP